MSQLKQSTRQEVFDRRGHECIFCGVTGEQHEQEHGRDLDIHHVIPKREGGSNDPDNLIPVCIGCHRTIESTQGEALSRIANEELDRQKLLDNTNDLREKVREYKREVAELDASITGILEGVDVLFDECASSKLYVVHETRFTTSHLLYAGTSIEDAKEKFESSDEHVTMETVSFTYDINASDIYKSDLRRIRDKSEILADLLDDRIESAAETAEDRTGSIQNALESEGIGR